MTMHFTLLLLLVVFWTFPAAEALDCTRVELSCPADFGQHHQKKTNKKKKKHTAMAVTTTTADERRVPICVVVKNKKGKISYETRCKGETEEIQLHKHETSYHCGCCSSAVVGLQEEEESMLPEFCLSGRTTPQQQQQQQEASFETNAATTTSTTKATLQANAVVPTTTNTTTAVFETNAIIVNETCTVEEQILCNPAATLSGKGKGSRRRRRLYSPETLDEPFGTAPRGSATGGKLLRQGNGLVTQPQQRQQEPQHSQRRSLKMMKMNGKSTTTIAPGSIAICTSTSAKGKGKQETMCVDPSLPTTDVLEPFTCGCCPGQEELCIMPTMAPTTTNMTMESLFTTMGCYTQGNCVFSHNAATSTQYLVDDACTWTVTTSGTLTAEYFALEEDFDFLTVAGVRFTGTGVDSDSGSNLVLEGFTVNAGDTLLFYSDEIVTDTGFKVCLV